MKYIDVELSGIDFGDAPDFVDTYILSATVVEPNGVVREATEKELDTLNEDSHFIYQQIINRIY